MKRGYIVSKCVQNFTLRQDYVKKCEPFDEENVYCSKVSIHLSLTSKIVKKKEVENYSKYR